ncbi:nucleolin 1 [Pyrus ussuriensis x Pyrus communis]|uniref:Nucleolin 1 n=1 Tax=Pyrus ussuriensis x Pyrus communis TaxID=2448454 RepID=A0A5N5HLB5_9ROSA|nr:nucleolin 1 [Pyrus ussuriensis x Pyrus communis]
MGKSSKKSATKVEAPAVVVPAPKSGKKGIDSSRGCSAGIQKKKVEAKTQKKKKVETSSSEEESDVSSDPDVKAPKSKVAAQNGLTAAIKKKEVSAGSSDESSDESEDDDETPAKVTGQRPAAAAKKGPSVAVKKADTSSSGSEDEGTTKDEDSIDSSDSDEDMADTGTDGSEEEVSSDKEEDDEQPKTPKTPVTSSKTLFVGNLNFRIEEHDVRNFFKDAGEVVDIRFASDPEGKFKGFGHVEFATAEEAKKALEFNGLELLGRDVKLDLARERGEKGAYTPTGSESNSYQKGPRGASKTIFIRGFDSSLGEDEIRSSLQEVFSSCGEITRVSIPKDYETGASKGFNGYMDFTDADSFNKALGLDGSEFGDSYLKVEEAKPKGDFGTPRSNDRSFSSNRGGGRFSRGGDRGRGFRGRRGGRDGGRGGRDGGRGRGRGKKYT